MSIIFYMLHNENKNMIMEELFMKEILLADLIAEAKTVIQTFGYATSTLVFYNRHWRNLKNYFDKNRIKMFSVQMSDQFLKEHKRKMKAGKISASNYRSVKRAIHFIQDYYANGTTSWKRIVKKVEEIQNMRFLQIANEFSCFLRDMQKSILFKSLVMKNISSGLQDIRLK